MQIFKNDLFKYTKARVGKESGVGAFLPGSATANDLSSLAVHMFLNAGINAAAGGRSGTKCSIYSSVDTLCQVMA